MNAEEAAKIRSEASKIEWTFPSSSGAPMFGDKYRLLVERRAEFANAARWYIDHGDADAALEIAANSWRMWVKLKDPQEGLSFIEEVLQAGRTKDPSRSLAIVLYGDALLAFRNNQFDRSRQLSEEAVSVAEKIKDTEALALSYTGLTRAVLEAGDAQKALPLASKAREYALKIGKGMEQAPTHLLAQATRFEGDYNKAAALFGESLALNRKIGDKGMVAVELHNLGWVYIHLGKADSAKSCFDECSNLDSEKDSYSIALVTMNRSAVAFVCGNAAEARVLLAKANEYFAAHKDELGSDERRELHWLSVQLQSDT